MQEKLIDIIISTSSEDAKKHLLENLFAQRDLSLKIYNEADKLLQDRNFRKKAKIKGKTSLEFYYKVMYALYLQNEFNY